MDIFQRMSRIERYMELYNEASTILKKYNPCHICRGKCVSAHHTTKYPKELCCYGCKHLSSKGCTTIALTCKAWLCASAQESCPQCAQELSVVMQKIIDEGFYGVRETLSNIL